MEISVLLAGSIKHGMLVTGIPAARPGKRDLQLGATPAAAVNWRGRPHDRVDHAAGPMRKQHLSAAHVVHVL